MKAIFSIVFLFCTFLFGFALEAQETNHIDLCRTANKSNNGIFLREDASEDSSSVSVIGEDENVSLISQDVDDQERIWFLVERSDGVQGFVASWLMSKPDCTEVKVLPSQGEDCVQLYQKDNLLFESVSITRYSGVLSVQEIIDIADFLDSYIDQTYTDRPILIHFVNSHEEGRRLFPEIWDDTSHGVHGWLSFDGCELFPGSTGQMEAIVIKNDTFTVSTLAVELANAMNESDSQYWSDLFDVSIFQGCSSFSEEIDIVRCEEILEILD